MWIPCGHLVLCAHCAIGSLLHTTPGTSCPTCRASFDFAEARSVWGARCSREGGFCPCRECVFYLFTRACAKRAFRGLASPTVELEVYLSTRGLIFPQFGLSAAVSYQRQCLLKKGFRSWQRNLVREAVENRGSLGTTTSHSLSEGLQQLFSLWTTGRRAVARNAALHRLHSSEDHITTDSGPAIALPICADSAPVLERVASWVGTAIIRAEARKRESGRCPVIQFSSSAAVESCLNAGVRKLERLYWSMAKGGSRHIAGIPEVGSEVLSVTTTPIQTKGSCRS